LSWQIDAKHGSREYLSHRAFRYDLTFLRHAPNIAANVQVSTYVEPKIVRI
jgi:hypothetical protein